MVRLEKRYSVDMVLSRPNEVFVYGDNLENWGKKGQAIIRDCENTLGIPTKRRPSMDDDAFFSDLPDEFEVVKNAIIKLDKMIVDGVDIVLPVDGIGTGLGKLEIKSPRIFNYLKFELMRIKNGLPRQHSHFIDYKIDQDNHQDYLNKT